MKKLYKNTELKDAKTSNYWVIQSKPDFEQMLNALHAHRHLDLKDWVSKAKDLTDRFGNLATEGSQFLLLEDRPSHQSELHALCLNRSIDRLVYDTLADIAKIRRSDSWDEKLLIFVIGELHPVVTDALWDQVRNTVNTISKDLFNQRDELERRDAQDHSSEGILP